MQQPTTRDAWAINVVFGQRPTERNHRNMRNRTQHDQDRIKWLLTLRCVLHLGTEDFNRLGTHHPFFRGVGKKKQKRREAMLHLLRHRTATTYAKMICQERLSFYQP